MRSKAVSILVSENFTLSKGNAFSHCYTLEKGGTSSKECEVQWGMSAFSQEKRLWVGGLDLRSYKNAVPRKRPGLALPLLREGIVTRSRPVQAVFNIQLLSKILLDPEYKIITISPSISGVFLLSALHLQLQSGYNLFLFILLLITTYLIDISSPL